MKKYMFPILLSLLFFFVLPSFANPSRDGDEGEPIPIQVNDPGEEDEHNHLRSLVPVEAYHVSLTQNVAVNFLYNLGSVTITLTNLTTSSSSVTIVDSSVGSILIPVSLGTGIYRIEFCCQDSGNEYVGYFNY